MPLNLDLIDTSLSAVTAVAASYLAYAALAHSARPRARVKLTAHEQTYPDQVVLFVFSFRNRGYWYSRPMIVNMTTYINFPPEFGPVEMRFGSTQQNTNDTVKVGKGGVKYLKAKGMHLSYGEDWEEIHVLAKTPTKPGRYRIKVSAFSENGVSLSEVCEIHVLSGVARVGVATEGARALPTP